MYYVKYLIYTNTSRIENKKTEYSYYIQLL